MTESEKENPTHGCHAPAAFSCSKSQNKPDCREKSFDRCPKAEMMLRFSLSNPVSNAMLLVVSARSTALADAGARRSYRCGI